MNKILNKDTVKLSSQKNIMSFSEYFEGSLLVMVWEKAVTLIFRAWAKYLRFFWEQWHSTCLGKLGTLLTIHGQGLESLR